MSTEITSITTTNGTVYQIDGSTISVTLPEIKGTSIKSLGDNRIGGYGVVWGSPEQRDSYGEYFTPETDFWLDWIPVKMMITTFDHTMSPLPPNVPANTKRDWVIGHIDSIKADDYGLWVEAILDEHKEWLEYIKELIDAGVMGYSSEAVSHLCERTPDGWIKSWALCGFGVTHHPAEPLIGKVNLVKRVHELNEVISVYKSLNAIQALEALQKEAVQATAQDGIQSEDEPKEVKNMADNFALEAEATLHAFIDAHWNQIKSAIKQEEGEAPAEGGSGDLNSLLMPYAEGLAQLVGISTEEAMADLSAYVASKMATEEVAVEESMPEEMMNAPVLNIDAEAFAREVAKHVKPEKPQAGAAVHNTPVFNITRKNVGQVGRAVKPKSLGRMIRAIAHKNYSELKALGINPDTAGGYLVPTEQSNQIIELLRSQSLFLQGEANRLVTFLPMASDTLTVPKLTTGATVSWFDENTQITDNSPAFGNIQLVAKKMACLIKISNELLEDSDPAVDALIREDITRAMTNEVDRVILEGSGIGSEPLGLANNPDAALTKTALNAVPTYANLETAINNVEVADVMVDDSWAWIFHPREKSTLRNLVDGASNYIFTGSGFYGQAAVNPIPEMIMGYPYHTTSQINIDTANNNETRMYFGRWRDVVVGMKKTISIMASAEAGTSFEYDQTWIRAILRMDTNIRHGESIEILTDVRTS